MSVSTVTDDDSASVLSASSAASYQRRKKAKEQVNIHRYQIPMSVSDYSDYSRYPKFTTKTVETEGPGIRMRETTTYDDNVLPTGYTPVTKTTTVVEEEPAPRRSRRHRHSPSSGSPLMGEPKVRHEMTAVPNPTAPGGVSPHVVTHVHLEAPKRSSRRRHRSVSREPPPVSSRPAYGRRRSRSYDASYGSQTQIINVPPPQTYPAPGYMYGPPAPAVAPIAPRPMPPLRPLPASPEFGYGRPAGVGGAGGAYGGMTPPFVPSPPSAPTVTVIQPSAPAAASAPISPYPSSRRRAMSTAYMPSAAAGAAPTVTVVQPSAGVAATTTPLSPYSNYGGASPMAMGAGQYSPYGGASPVMGPGPMPVPGAASTAPNITVISPSAPSVPYASTGYGASAAAASSVYPQSGYGASMGPTASVAPAPVVINVPPPVTVPVEGMMGGGMGMAGSRRARAMSMNGAGMGMNGMGGNGMGMMNGMGTGATPYGSAATAPGAGIGNVLGGGAGNFVPPPASGSAYGGGGGGYGGYGGGGGYGGPGGPGGPDSIGYGQSANGVYGYGPGQARDPTPGGTAPSPPPMQRPPGTGFFGGLFGSKNPNSAAAQPGGPLAPGSANVENPYAQDQMYGNPMRGGYYN